MTSAGLWSAIGLTLGIGIMALGVLIEADLILQVVQEQWRRRRRR